MTTETMEVIRAELRSLNDKIDALEREMRKTTNTNIIEKKTVVTKKDDMIFPWTGVVNETKCHGLRVNHGLYTQCENQINNEGTKLCKTCHGQSVKNGSDKPNSGRVEDRMNVDMMDYIDKKTGKRCLSWLAVLKKLNISKEDGLDAANRNGITIPECQLTEETTKKRGRPKKPTESEEGGVGDVSPKKSRGRPKKEKKVLESLAGDDLIANMIATMGSNSSSSIVDVNMNMNNDSNDMTDVISKNDEELEEESVTEVSMLRVNGKDYLLDINNVVYDVNTQEEIGTYNEENNTITKTQN